MLQIALIAGDTFSCVQLFLSFLYLVSMESSGTGYYPSNALVSCLTDFSPIGSWSGSNDFCGMLLSSAMLCHDMQQLCLFGGLLVIFAIINVQPLRVVGRLSELGALFNLVGQAAICALLLQSLPTS